MPVTVVFDTNILFSATGCCDRLLPCAFRSFASFNRKERKEHRKE